MFPSTLSLRTRIIVARANSQALHAFVNHLAEVQGLVCQLRPTPVQDNFKDRPHQPACRLEKDEAILLSTPVPDLTRTQSASLTLKGPL